MENGYGASDRARARASRSLAHAQSAARLLRSGTDAALRWVLAFVLVVTLCPLPATSVAEAVEPADPAASSNPAADSQDSSGETGDDVNQEPQVAEPQEPSNEPSADAQPSDKAESSEPEEEDRGGALPETSAPETPADWRAAAQAVDAGELTGDNFKPQGSGTQVEPYSIATPEAFAWWALLHPDAHATLASDIDLTARTNADGEPLPWPGDSTLAATLDGAGHSVSFVTEDAGLFAEVAQSGTAQWLYLGEPLDAAKRPSKVASAETLAGALAGTNKGAVQGVVNRLPVSVAEAADGAPAAAREAFAGGIVAVNDGVVRDCANLGDVANRSAQGNSAAAGIAAQGVGRIETSYNVGNVRAAQNGAYLTTLLTADGTYDDIVDDASCYLAAGEATYEGIAQAGADRKGTISSDDLKAAAERLNAGREGDAAVWSAGTAAANGYPAPAKPAAPAAVRAAAEPAPAAATYSTWAEVGQAMYEATSGHPSYTFKTPDGREIHQPTTVQGETEYDSTVTVENAEQLAMVMYAVNEDKGYVCMADIVLAANIDLQGTPYTGDTTGAIENALPWVPIGKGGNSYQGSFDGGGHTVSNMYVSVSASDGNTSQGVGLIGKHGGSGDAFVSDLHVQGRIDLFKTGLEYIGGVAGSFNEYGMGNGAIRRCTSDVDIRPAQSSTVATAYIGGVVGYASSTTISECSYTGEIGGPAGSDASQFAVKDVGGIAGYLSGDGAIDCFSRGVLKTLNPIDATRGMGGIVGSGDIDRFATTRCYSTLGQGDIPTAFASRVGALACTGSISESYYNKELNPLAGQASVSGATSMTLDQMKQASFASTLNNGRTGEDETATGYAPWSPDENNSNGGFPVLKSNLGPKYADWLDVGQAVDAGDLPGKPADPNASTIEVSMPETLAWVAYKGTTEQYGSILTSGKVLSIANDIDLTGVDYGGTEAAPLRWPGFFSLGAEINGNGHTVRGVNVYQADGVSASNAGLITTMEGGSLKGLTIADSSIKDGDNAGALVGMTSLGAAIERCSVGKSVTVSGEICAGGLIGNEGSGTVTDCLSRASVSSSKGYAGGIVGKPNKTKFFNCLGAPTALVKGTDKSSGAIVGSNNSVTVSNCYYDSSLPGDIGMGTPQTTAQLTELRGAAVAGLLDGDRAGETSVWRADFSAKNDGYPTLRPGGEQAVLSWLDVGNLANDGVIRRADGTGYFPRAENNVYLTDTPEILASIWRGLFFSYSGTNIQLTADIDLMGAMYTNNSGEPLAWMMLPQRTVGAYTGTFDGGSHTISNMRAVANPDNGSWNANVTEYAGFFTTLGDGAVVKDLNFVSSTAEGRYAGILVGAIGGTYSGQAEGNTTVSRCSVAADCTVTGLTPGGIAGTVYAGKTNPSIVEDCFSRATVTGTNIAAAGIAGAVTKQTPYVTSSTPTAKVQIKHCYSAGSLSAPNNKTYVRGLVGVHELVALELEKCIYPDTVDGVNSISGTLTNTSEARTLEAMRESDGAVLSVFLNDGRAASSVWRADWFAKNDGYPVLGKSDDPTITSWEDVGRLVANKQIEGEPYSPEHDGSSPEKALIIDSPEGLAWLEYAISVAPDMFKSAYVKLSTDIDMFGTKYTGIEPTAPADAGSALPGNIEKALPWVSICESDDGFAGTFDGAGHTVSRLYRSGEGKSGLFKALIGGARCENVVVAESLLESTDMYCGAIAGEIEWSTVSGCASVDNLVKGAYSAGGVVGRTGSESNIEDCYSRSKVESAAGSVSNGGTAGGILGGAGGRFSMSHCYSAGTVVSIGGNDYKGALAGSLEGAGSNDLFVDCFYRQGDAANAVGYAPPEVYRPGTMTAKTEAQLTSLDMPALLNAGRADGPWTTDFAAKNDGYPVIGRSYGFTNWQQVGASVTEAQLRLWPVYNSDGTADGFALTGDGKSADTAYVLRSPEALAWYANAAITEPMTYGAMHVNLGADINLSGVAYTGVGEKLPWVPISTYSGVFDGQNHAIASLYINAALDNQGLFGTLGAGATVQNVSLDGEVTGKNHVGLLAGTANGNVTLKSCFTSGAVRGSDSAGSLLGGHYDNTNNLQVDSCSNTATVRSGITGSADNRASGGLVGAVNTAGFTNSSNRGSVAGGVNMFSGGFVGAVKSSSSSGLTVTNCYLASTVANGKTVFAGSNANPKVVNSYYDKDVLGKTMAGDANGIALTTAQMKTWGMAADLNGKAAGAGTVWTQDATVNDGYPTPMGLTGTPLPAANWQRVGLAVYQSEGRYGLSKPALELGAMDGTAAHPIELGTTEALAYYQYMMGSYATVDTVTGSGVTWKNASVKLTDDISLAGKYNGVKTDGTAAAATQWVPISTLSGTFDGNGRTVSNMDLSGNNVAFIHTVQDGIVEKLTVQGPDTWNTQVAAGIVLFARGSSRIVDCTNNKILHSTMNSVDQGGIVYSATDSTQIVRCANIATLTWDGGQSGTSTAVGGIAARLGAGCSVIDCYNTGYLRGAGCYIGGMVGINSGGTISNCYNVGGMYTLYGAAPSDIVGTGSGTVTNCYATTSYGTLPAGVTRVSQSAMKSVLMAFQLNNGRTNIDDPANAAYAPWTWNPLVNSGYPSFGTPKVTQIATWEDVAKLQQEDALRRTKVTFTEGYGYAGDLQSAAPNNGNYTAALSGAGTSGDAYVVSTPEALAWAAWQVNQNANTVTELYVELGAGIDLAGLDYTGANSVSSDFTNCLKWMPMGTYRGSGTSSTFAGGFDGKNFPIKNLYVNGPRYYAALIGYVGSSGVDTTVKNIVLKSGYSSTTAYASALIGDVFGRVQVQDCHNEGVSVETSSGSIAGGLVASAVNGSSLVMERCSNHALVKSSDAASGLVGSYAYGATVRNCYNTGLIQATNTTGVAAGIYSRTDSSINISNSYNTGAIAVPSGGGTAYAVGSPNATMSNCWYDSEETGTVTARPGATGVTTAQMKTWGAAYQLNGGNGANALSSYTTWRKAKPGENDGYPVLCARNASGASTESMDAASSWADVGEWAEYFNTASKPNGAGTAASPYAIKTPVQLAWFAYVVNKGRIPYHADTKAYDMSANLDANIDLFGAAFTGKTATTPVDGVSSNIDDALKWNPIGDYAGAVVSDVDGGNRFRWYFGATFDGQNKQVSNLYCSNNTQQFMGLFGYVGWTESDATSIRNLKVGGKLASSRSTVSMGLVVGSAGSGQVVIDNCSTTGTSSLDAGASATGAASAGGILGECPSATTATVSNCTNAGRVFTSANVNSTYNLCMGGILGRGAPVIDGCINNGKVEQADSSLTNKPATLVSVGGIAGLATLGFKVLRSSNEGAVTASVGGGIVGRVSGKGSIEDCYNRGKVTDSTGKGTAAGIAGVAIDASVVLDISSCYSTGALTGNTSSTWGIVGGLTGSTALANCYYLEGTAPKAARDKADAADACSKTAEQMQNAMLAVTLNAKRQGANAPWGWKSDVNDAYPNLTTGQALVTSWAEVGAAQTEKELRAANELSGSGTSDDPFAISTPRALAWWAYQVNNHSGSKTHGADGVAETGVFYTDSHVKLAAPISLAGLSYRGDNAVDMGSNYENGLIWEPVGKWSVDSDHWGEGVSYDGTFDGCGRMITNLHLVHNATYSTGFFGLVSDSAVVKRVGLASGATSLGSNSDAVGSLIGWNYGTVENCYSLVSMVDATSVGEFVGGLLGHNEDGVLKNSYFAGASSVTDLDGIVGLDESSSADAISNCFTTCATNNGTQVTASQLKSWGGAYQLNDPRNADGTYKPVANNNVWKQDVDTKDAPKVNKGYPVLIAEGSGERVQNPSSWDDVGYWVDAFATDLRPGGTGASSDTFKVASPEALAWFANGVNDKTLDSSHQNVTLTEDVSLLGDQFTGKASPSLYWCVIGESNRGDYCGTFDGGNKTVKNMRAGASGAVDMQAGFIGDAWSARVMNLHVQGSSGAYANNGATSSSGLVVGRLTGGTISGCTSAGTVTGTSGSTSNAYAGGIVGSLQGTMENCTSTAAVSSKTDSTSTTNASGGLAGLATSSGSATTIKGCMSSGTAKDESGLLGSGAAGGVVGVIGGDGKVTVQDCAAAGTVTATLFSGGIVGYTGVSARIENSYSRATIAGIRGDTWRCGVVGRCELPDSSTVVISRCFWLDQDGVSDVDGGDEANKTDCLPLSDVQLKGRVDMKADGAPTAGLGGTNVVDVLNTLDSGERTGSAAVWIVAPDKRNDGYPDFETASVVETGTATVSPSTGSAATSGSSDVGASSVVLTKMNLLRPPRLYDGSGTAANPLKTPTWELVSGSSVADNYALWASGSDKDASADKKLGLFVTTTQTGGAESDLSGHDGATNPDMGAMGGFRVRAAAAYSETKPRTVEFLLTDNLGTVRRQTVTISGVTARTLDVTVPVEANLGSITPDAKLHTGTTAATAKGDSVVQNKTEAPVQGSVTSVSALATETVTETQIGSDGAALKVNTVLPTKGGAATLTANNRSIVDAANPNAKLGVKGTETSGLATLDKALYTGAIAGDAPGTLPLAMTLAGGTATVPRQVGFRWFLDYTGTWIGDDAVYGYAASYRFAPATKDVLPDTLASIGEAASK